MCSAECCKPHQEEARKKELESKNNNSKAGGSQVVSELDLEIIAYKRSCFDGGSDPPNSSATEGLAPVSVVKPRQLLGASSVQTNVHQDTIFNKIERPSPVRESTEAHILKPEESTRTQPSRPRGKQLALVRTTSHDARALSSNRKAPRLARLHASRVSIPCFPLIKPDIVVGPAHADASVPNKFPPVSAPFCDIHSCLAQLQQAPPQRRGGGTDGGREGGKERGWDAGREGGWERDQNHPQLWRAAPSWCGQN